MKGTVHFTGTTGRESAFDPTKNRDVTRSNGKYGDLPSIHLSYETGVADEYLKRHSPSPVSYDLFRTARFPDEAKSVKKRSEEAEAEAQKLVLYPNYEYLSNKGKSFAKVSFTKAERRLIASPLDLQPKAVGPRKKPEEETKEEESDPADNPETKYAHDPIMNMFSNTDADMNFVARYKAAKEKEEEECLTPSEHAEVVEEEAEKAKADARKVEREAMWREMHNHVPGEYRMDVCPGRDGFGAESIRRGKVAALKERKRKGSLAMQKAYESKSVRAVRNARKQPQIESDGEGGKESETSEADRKAHDVDTYERRKKIESEKTTRDLRAPLFRSYTDRSKAPVGEPKGLEQHQYDVQLDPEQSRRRQVDRQVIGRGIGNAKRIEIHDPVEQRRKKASSVPLLNRKQKAQLKGDDAETAMSSSVLAKNPDRSIRTGGGSPVNSSAPPLPAIGPSSLTAKQQQKRLADQRSTMFDNLIHELDPKVLEEEAEARKQGVNLAIINREKGGMKVVPKAHKQRGHTGFHLEDFLHSKQFKRKVKAYEEEILRVNLEAMEAEASSSTKDTKSPGRSKRQQQQEELKKVPIRRTVEEEEARAAKLEHLRALTGLDVDKDDTTKQWDGSLAKERRAVPHVGLTAGRWNDTSDLSTWTTPDIKDLHKLRVLRERRQKELDQQYATEMHEYDESVFMAAKQAAVLLQQQGEGNMSVSQRPMMEASIKSNVSGKRSPKSPKRKKQATLSDFMPQAPSDATL